MREILFRGKTIKTRFGGGKWIEGFYAMSCAGRAEMEPAIITGTEKGCFMTEFIDPATIGQFTGHFSKEKAKVFEGDILKDLSETAPSYKNAVYVVIWDKENACFALNYYDTLGYKNVPHKLIETNGFKDVFKLEEWARIIGNIHDNPELLKEEESK